MRIDCDKFDQLKINNVYHDNRNHCLYTLRIYFLLLFSVQVSENFTGLKYLHWLYCADAVVKSVVLNSEAEFFEKFVI